MLRLTEQDWLKLRDYCKHTAQDVMRKLPADWYLPAEEVESAVFDSIIKLLHVYKPGPMSPVTWCWRYMEKQTLRDLFKEYRRMKSQVGLEELDNPFAAPPSKSARKSVEERDLVAKASELAETHGLGAVVEDLKDGRTEREMADSLGVTQQAVHKKVEKLRKICRTLK